MTTATVVLGLGCRMASPMENGLFELGSAHGGRAHYADDNPGGVVGQDRSLPYGRAGGQGERQRGDHGVPRAGHVEDLACHGRDVGDPSVLFKEAHSPFPARDQDGLAAEPLKELAPGLQQARLVFALDPRRLDGFQVVRRDNRRAFVPADVGTLGSTITGTWCRWARSRTSVITRGVTTPLA